MTDYVVAKGDVGVEPWTTTPGQVDTVTFGDNVGRAQVVSDGAAEVRITNDGSTPVVGAAGSSTRSFRLPAGLVGVFDFPLPLAVDVVKIVSSGTAKVSVQVLV